MSKHFVQGWIVFFISSLDGYLLYQQTSFLKSITFLTELSLQSTLVMYGIFLMLLLFRLTPIYMWRARLVIACYSCYHAFLGPRILEQHGMMAYSFDFGFYISQFFLVWCALYSTGKEWIILYIVLILLHSIIIY